LSQIALDMLILHFNIPLYVLWCLLSLVKKEAVATNNNNDDDDNDL